MNAQQIADRIAPNEAALIDSLFNPVTFSDGTRGTYNGYVVSKTTTHIKFTFGTNKELFVNRSHVIGQWCELNDGRMWYSYCLNPFGNGVKYSDECNAGRLIFSKFSTGETKCNTK